MSTPEEIAREAAEGCREVIGAGPHQTDRFAEFILAAITRATASLADKLVGVERERDEARKDTVRLDWLESNHGSHVMGGCFQLYFFSHTQEGVSESIDAALLASTEHGKEKA